MAGSGYKMVRKKRLLAQDRSASSWPNRRSDKIGLFCRCAAAFAASKSVYQ